MAFDGCNSTVPPKTNAMIRKLPSGKYRLYSRKVNPKTGRRRDLGTFGSRAAAEKHERAVQYFQAAFDATSTIPPQSVHHFAGPWL